MNELDSMVIDETAYIEMLSSAGFWQQISSGYLDTIQADVEQWKRQSDYPIRAVDSRGRIVAM